MPFQSVVNIRNAFGAPGELATDTPRRAESLVVNSGAVNPNTVGHFFTKDNVSNVAQVGGAVGDPALNNAKTTGTLVIAGILANPKSYASYGTSSGTLEPTLNLPDNHQGEFLTMGDVVVQIGGACKIGDEVGYDPATGAIVPATAAGAAPIPGAVVYRYPVSAATGGLTVVRLTTGS